MLFQIFLFLWLARIQACIWWLNMLR